MESSGRCRRRVASGFTLIELLVTIAVLAIALALGVPSFRETMQRNRVASASNDLVAALAQARGLAIANNACATLCTAAVTGVAAPTCGTPGDRGYQDGWLVFVNPACDAAQTDPTTAGATLRQARDAGEPSVSVVASDDAFYRLMFDPRGIPNSAAATRVQVQVEGDAEHKFARTVCLDAAGRATIRRYTSTCG
jgi:type IV fimbrial biogenesis protein FimT